MRRLLAITLLGLWAAAVPRGAAAQESAVPLSPALALNTLALASAAEAASSPRVSPAPRGFEYRRGTILPSLYGATILLQGYDTYSTLAVLKHGGVEANPVMKGITQHPAAFIGLKAGVTFMSVMAAERMWKRHNRVAAVATMAVTNGLMAVVAANNSRVLARVRR